MSTKDANKDPEQSAQDKQIEMWKVKKLMKSLQAARGYDIVLYNSGRLWCFYFMRTRYRNGTSMISLITPPKDQVSRISKMLADEYGTASNIKSRVNR
jgi:peptide chain release factor subunit 1